MSDKSRFIFTYQEWELLPDRNKDSIRIAEQGATALNKLLIEMVDVIVESGDTQRAAGLYLDQIDVFDIRYPSVGISDSDVREILFSRVADYAEIDYDEIYLAWFNS